MMLETVLVFVMNTKAIKIEQVASPVPLNYCVGYRVHDDLWLTCLTMEDKIYDYRLEGKTGA